MHTHYVLPGLVRIMKANIYSVLFVHVAMMASRVLRLKCTTAAATSSDFLVSSFGVSWSPTKDAFPQKNTRYFFLIMCKGFVLLAGAHASTLSTQAHYNTSGPTKGTCCFYTGSIHWIAECVKCELAIYFVPTQNESKNASLEITAGRQKCLKERETNTQKVTDSFASVKYPVLPLFFCTGAPHYTYSFRA